MGSAGSFVKNAEVIVFENRLDSAASTSLNPPNIYNDFEKNINGHSYIYR